MARLNSVFSWDISQLKCLVCYKEVGDALEMKKSTMFKWHTRSKQGQKSIQDGPRSGCRKIISGKLVTHYERRRL